MGIVLKKIEEWWEIITIIGAAGFVVSLLFDSPNINMRHLTGLFVGLFIMGISCWASVKTIYKEVPGGIFTGRIVKFTPITKSIFIVGVLITVLFLTLLLIDLI